MDNSEYRVPHKLHRALLLCIVTGKFHTKRRGARNTRYIKNAYTYPVVSIRSLGKLNQRRLDQANAEKLIIGGMTLKLECYLDQGEYLAGKSTVIVLPNENVPLLYLAAVLNSECASYWYRTFFKSMSLAGGYLRIGHKQVGEIPIPKYDRKSCGELLQVAQVLQQQPSDLSAWKRLNMLVCERYGLSGEEMEKLKSSS